MRAASMLEGVRFRFGPLVHQAYGIPADTSDVHELLTYACEFVNEDRLDRIHRAPPHLRPRAPFHTLAQGRDEWSDLLNAAIDKRPELVRPSDAELSAARAELQTTVGWRLILEQTRKGPRLLQEARISTDEGMRAVFRVALMHRAYRELLRRCPQCGARFMRKGKRKFCGDPCAQAANGAGLAQRQKGRRLRLATLALLPGGASRERRLAAIKSAHKAHPEVTTPEQLREHAIPLLKSARKHK